MNSESLIDALVGVGELFGQPLSKQSMKFYLMALSDLSPDELTTGFSRIVKESKFWPRPAELREFCTGVAAKLSASAKAAQLWAWCAKWAPEYVLGPSYAIKVGDTVHSRRAHSLAKGFAFAFKLRNKAAEDLAEAQKLHDKAQESLTKCLDNAAKWSSWSEEVFDEQMDYLQRVEEFLDPLDRTLADAWGKDETKDRTKPIPPPPTEVDPTFTVYLGEAIQKLKSFLDEGQLMPSVGKYLPSFVNTLTQSLRCFAYCFECQPTQFCLIGQKPEGVKGLKRDRSLFRNSKPELAVAKDLHGQALATLQAAQAEYDHLLSSIYETTITVPPAIPPLVEQILIQLEGSCLHGIKRISKFVKNSDDKYLRYNFEQYAMVVIAEQTDAPYVSPTRLLESSAIADDSRMYRGFFGWKASTSRWEEDWLRPLPLDRLQNHSAAYVSEYEAFLDFVSGGAQSDFAERDEEDEEDDEDFNPYR